MPASASIPTWRSVWKVTLRVSDQSTAKHADDDPHMIPCSVRPPADLNGVDLNPVQDTPVATRKEDTYIHFSVDVEIQRHVEKLPKGKNTNIHCII